MLIEHIEDALGLDDARTFRATFNEITRTAVLKAIAAPGKIDRDRVKAQEARRILDRVVGYPLSNLLSKKVTEDHEVKGGEAAGDLYVRLVVALPDKPDAELTRFAEQWKAAYDPRAKMH